MRRLILLAIAVTGAACGRPEPSPAPTPSPTTTAVVMARDAAAASPADAAEDPLAGAVAAVKRDTSAHPTTTFSHRVHGQPAVVEKVSCDTCHALVLDGNRARSSPDSVCTSCHAKDNRLAEYKASAAAAGRPPRTGSPPPIHRIHAAFTCDKCHSSLRLSDKVGDFPLPPTDNTDPVCVQCHGKAVRFSHVAHVNVEGKVAAECERCHLPTPQGVLFGTPGHTQCWSCHDITLLGLTAGCNLCHLEEVRDKKTYNIEEASSRHKEHPSLKCADCHGPILTAQTLPELKAAREESAEHSCKRCHDTGASPSPAGKRP